MLHAVLLLTAFVAPATQPAARDLAPVIAPIVEKHKLPAMAAAVIEGTTVVGLGAVGVRAAGSTEPVTTNDLWHLGSCTKAMTATLAAALVEKGSLAWNTTIGDVFSDIPMNDAWRAVTLDQLLHNRAGAPADLNRDGLWANLFTHAGTPREQRLDLCRGVLAWEPDVAPGEKFIYSNAGFALAGAMLERKSGKAWEDLMREHVFAPLTITHAGFGAPGSAETVDQPRGHRAGISTPPGPRSDNPAAIGPAGTVHMSITDWARFVSAHLIGERGESPLLPAPAFKHLHEPVPDPQTEYAAGWLVMSRPWAKGDQPQDTGRVLMHNGSNTMWYCVTWLAPERNFAILITCNQGDKGADAACDEAAGALVEDYLASPKGK